MGDGDGKAVGTFVGATKPIDSTANPPSVLISPAAESRRSCCTMERPDGELSKLARSTTLPGSTAITGATLAFASTLVSETRSLVSVGPSSCETDESK